MISPFTAPVRFRRFPLALACALSLLCAAFNLPADDLAKSNSTALVPLKLDLPAPVFAGTPKDAPQGVDVEPVPKNPPAPLKVPADVRNLAPAAKISSSDHAASAATLAKIVDGKKDADQDSIVMLRKGLQWVEFDLGAPQEIYAVVFWHAHDVAKVYKSVVVQIADDPDFTANVRTLFNNDRDNSAGFGVGTDRQYFETYMGKIVDAKGAPARYVRLYSHGSTDSALNEYTEVEIYGRPAPGK